MKIKKFFVVAVLIVLCLASVFGEDVEVSQANSTEYTSSTTTLPEMETTTTLTRNLLGEKLGTKLGYKKSFYKKDDIAKRDPKFGFNIPIRLPGLGDPINSTPYPYDSNLQGNINDPNFQNQNQNQGVDPLAIGIASTLSLIKGGVLGGITAVKAAIIPPLFIGAAIIFLIAGAAFFTCNIVNCGNVFGAGGSLTNFLSRNGYEPHQNWDWNWEQQQTSTPNYADYYQYYQSQIQPVYQALDAGNIKYGSN